MIHQAGSGPSRDQLLHLWTTLLTEKLIALPGPSLWPPDIGYGGERGRPGRDARYAATGTRRMRNMHHFYSRGAFYLAYMAAGVVLMLLFYFRSGQLWALWVWLWT